MKTQAKKTNILMGLLVTTLISSQALAMAKAPVTDTTDTTDRSTTTTPSTPVVREPAAYTGSITPADFNVFTEVSYPVGSLVDSKFQSYRELIPERNAQEGQTTDACDTTPDGQDRFSDRIAYAVEVKMHPSQAGLGYVGSYYGLSSDESTYTPNSLISHPLCNVTADTLNTTLGGKKIPSAATIKKANTFVDTMNSYRRAALAGDREGYVKASKLWSKFMMCVSYTESLTTANTSTSDRVAAKYAPAGYRRPASVLFYEDPYQDAASRLNIGLFQFTPNSAGNVQACIREWNKLYPKCTVSTKASQGDMIRVLGSSLQTFNAFCGAAKVTGMFSVQINTKSSSFTHPYNVVNGKLKAPADRCVSPHFAAGKSYNHFGPFQNSVGTNLDEVLSCTLNGEY
ncbi:MAG TPA: hypothetical protein VF412_14465 [Bdellovibrio sp.]|uniref:hypothetical protein n=1 Tax=Bdellovibrio sp. TaxID=28201 RepID=UPI002F122D61